MPDNKSVLIGVPTYSQQMSSPTATTLLNGFVWGLTHKTNVWWSLTSSSLLAHGFNMLWCTALQMKPDYFVMMHADIGAEDGWLGTLIDEIETTGADMVSCVVPIKDDGKTTSTAAYVDNDCRRLTYAEIMRLPPTFGHDEVKQIIPDSQCLLVNTGLWIAKYADWWRDWKGFEILSRIRWDEEGNPKPTVFSEDWQLSRSWQAMGKKILATSKVQVHHIGWKSWVGPQSLEITNGSSTKAEVLQTV